MKPLVLAESRRQTILLVAACLSLICFFAAFILFVYSAHIKIKVDKRMSLIETYNSNVIPGLFAFVGVMNVVQNVSCIFVLVKIRNPEKREDLLKFLLPILIGGSLLVIFELIAAITSFIHISVLNKEFGSGLKKGMAQYAQGKEMKKEMDNVQLDYRCCGDRAYTDWFRFPWIETKSVYAAEGSVDKFLQEGNAYYSDDTPFSCCDMHAPRPCVHHHVHHNEHHHNYNYLEETTLYSDGCRSVLMAVYARLLTTVGLIGLLIAFVKITLLLMVRLLQTSLIAAKEYDDWEKTTFGYIYFLKVDDEDEEALEGKETELDDETDDTEGETDEETETDADAESPTDTEEGTPEDESFNANNTENNTSEIENESSEETERENWPPQRHSDGKEEHEEFEEESYMPVGLVSMTKRGNRISVTTDPNLQDVQDEPRHSKSKSMQDLSEDEDVSESNSGETERISWAASTGERPSSRRISPDMTNNYSKRATVYNLPKKLMDQSFQTSDSSESSAESTSDSSLSGEEHYFKRSTHSQNTNFSKNMNRPWKIFKQLSDGKKCTKIKNGKWQKDSTYEDNDSRAVDEMPDFCEQDNSDTDGLQANGCKSTLQKRDNTNLYGKGTSGVTRLKPETKRFGDDSKLTAEKKYKKNPSCMEVISSTSPESDHSKRKEAEVLNESWLKDSLSGDENFSGRSNSARSTSSSREQFSNSDCERNENIRTEDNFALKNREQSSALKRNFRPFENADNTNIYSQDHFWPFHQKDLPNIGTGESSKRYLEVKRDFPNNDIELGINEDLPAERKRQACYPRGKSNLASDLVTKIKNHLKRYKRKYSKPNRCTNKGYKYTLLDYKEKSLEEINFSYDKQIGHSEIGQVNQTELLQNPEPLKVANSRSDQNNSQRLKIMKRYATDGNFHSSFSKMRAVDMPLINAAGLRHGTYSKPEISKKSDMLQATRHNGKIHNQPGIKGNSENRGSYTKQTFLETPFSSPRDESNTSSGQRIKNSLLCNYFTERDEIDLFSPSCVPERDTSSKMPSVDYRRRCNPYQIEASHNSLEDCDMIPTRDSDESCYSFSPESCNSATPVSTEKPTRDITTGKKCPEPTSIPFMWQQKHSSFENSKQNPTTLNADTSNMAKTKCQQDTLISPIYGNPAFSDGLGLHISGLRDDYKRAMIKKENTSVVGSPLDSSCANQLRSSTTNHHQKNHIRSYNRTPSNSSGFPGFSTPTSTQDSFVIVDLSNRTAQKKYEKQHQRKQKGMQQLVAGSPLDTSTPLTHNVRLKENADSVHAVEPHRVTLDNFDQNQEKERQFLFKQSSQMPAYELDPAHIESSTAPRCTRHQHVPLLSPDLKRTASINYFASTPVLELNSLYERDSEAVTSKRAHANQLLSSPEPLIVFSSSDDSNCPAKILNTPQVHSRPSSSKADLYQYDSPSSPPDRIRLESDREEGPVIEQNERHNLLSPFY